MIVYLRRRKSLPKGFRCFASLCQDEFIQIITRKENYIEIGDEICSCFWHWPAGRVRLAFSSLSPLDLGTIQLDRARLTGQSLQQGYTWQASALLLPASCLKNNSTAFLGVGMNLHSWHTGAAFTWPAQRYWKGHPTVPHSSQKPAWVGEQLNNKLNTYSQSFPLL